MNQPNDTRRNNSPKQLTAEDLAALEAESERQNAAFVVRSGVRAGAGNTRFRF